MQLLARFRPHPRGFGFAHFVADDRLTTRDVTVARQTGTTVTADRAFIPPPAARGLVADDLLSVTVSADDKGVSVDTIEVVDRPRRMLAGTLVEGPGRVVLEPDPSLATGWIDLDASVVSAAAGRPGSIVVILRAEGVDGKPLGRALVAGPFVAGSPKAVRAVATVVAYERAAPGLVAGGPAIAGLDDGDAALTHARFVGIVAGGGRGAATGLATTADTLDAAIDGLTVADRTDEWCVTVDAASSRDLDDAIGAAWSGSEDEPVAVQVHIADVAAAVAHDSAADRYARTIASSMYPVAGDNAPMLDPALSEDQLSLLPGQLRRVLSVRMLVDRQGEVAVEAVEAASIISGARLTYRAVEQLLGGDDTAIAAEVADQAHLTGHTDQASVTAVVTAMTEAARRLGHHRDRRLTFDELFAPVELDPVLVDGRLAVTEAEPHAEAYRLIERLMVAANEAVAAFLVEHDIPALYRVHEGLDSQRLDRLAAAAETVGVTLPSLDPDSDPTDVMSDVLTAIDQLDADGRSDDRNLLIAVATGAMARANYDADPSGHRGLASGAYTHFTSPIRRYADLVVHRQLRAALAGTTPPWDRQALRGLARWLDHRADAAGLLRATERRALWSLLLDRGHVDDTVSAVITGLTNNGLRIRLPRLGLGGFITAERALGLPAGQRGSLVVDDHQLTTSSGPWRVGSTADARFVGLDATQRPIWRLA